LRLLLYIGVVTESLLLLSHLFALQSPAAGSRKGSHLAAQGRARVASYHGDDSKQAMAGSPARTGREKDPSAGAADPKFQALIENVNMHLEATRKEADSVAAVAGAGSNKFPARGRSNNAGGALKKLNKRWVPCVVVLCCVVFVDVVVSATFVRCRALTCTVCLL
jgi:hypothetical protein